MRTTLMKLKIAYNDLKFAFPLFQSW